MGTQFLRTGSFLKKDCGSPFSSFPRSTSSNSTKTHMGACKSGRALLCGSAPSGHMCPRSVPIAPFINPASTRKFYVSSTRAPSHM
eukprot:9120723-Pyramimonas_sp.AAC.1